MFEFALNWLYYGAIFLMIFPVFTRMFAWYRRDKVSCSEKTIAFLHPYCDGAGGQERVLWDAIAYMMQQKDKLKFKQIVIYSRNQVTLSNVLKKVKSRFDIKISISNRRYLSLVPLKSSFIAKRRYHPKEKLFVESLSPIILAFEGLFKFTPHIFIDTTGFAFTYPVASLLFGCTVVSYTHYPTISSDILQQQYYYKLFSILYGFSGYFARFVMVNSTWTYNHIKLIFFQSKKSILRRVYPPCGNIEYLSKFKLDNRKKKILSVGQFRSEKNHKLQIEAFYEFRKQCKSKYNDINDIKLILVGGVGDIFDRRRVTKLRTLITKLDLREYIEIKENLEYNKLLKLFEESFIGLHTMEDESFGICLAEYMIAGLVTIGHCSGGPLSDIVANIKSENHNIKNKELRRKRGFLCTTKEEYAKCLETIFDEYHEGNGWSKLRQTARSYCLDKFSSLQFQLQFINIIKDVF